MDTILDNSSPIRRKERDKEMLEGIMNKITDLMKILVYTSKMLSKLQAR